MLLVRGRHAARPMLRRAPATCPECGHPAAAPDRSAASRLWHAVHPVQECFHADYDYSVLRDGWCGCRAEAHRLDGRRAS